jgi:pimeloyl-ACP methyl ester carboxylesterase
MQPLLELGGDGNAPLLHIAPANGFVPQTYLPLLRPLMEEFRVVCAPPRALWGDQQPPSLQHAPDWIHLAHDLLAAFEQYDLRDVVAVGHSFGGVASMNAAILDPSRFRALVLLDPTFLHENIVDMIAAAMAQGISDQHPLAQGAIKRKRDFESVEAFYERYRTKPTFADWDEEAMRLYAEHGTKPQGEGRVLTWSAEWEAFYFSTGFAETWRTIPKLNDLLPTLILRGGNSDTYTADSAQRVRELVPSATHATIEGHGHLFPQSAPHETARVIGEWLQSLER